MAIADDFEIQNDKDIRYTGAAHEVAGAGYYTVLELHEWLRDLADDASSTGDDYMDIARPTPSEKVYDTILQLLNGYNVDQTAVEHLYQGSIVQSDGDEIYDGIQVVASEGCHVEIVQDGSVLTNDFWNSTPDGESSEGLNRDVANGIASRFLVQVRTGGADIDGRRIICQTREWGKTYSEFKVNGTGRGVNVVPLTYADDLNNQTAIGTIAAIVDISNTTEGFVQLDVDNDDVDEDYYSEWDRGAQTINTFYEYMKWIARRGTAETLYGLNGEVFRGITHEIDVDNILSGPFNATEPVSWTGGTGQMLAIDSVSAPTVMYIQLLTGVAPTDGQTITGGTSGATADVNINVTEHTIATPFCGQSTGSALIGSYGFCLEVLDLGTNDKVTDLAGTVNSPPDYQDFTLAGLVDGEDYALVGPRGYRFFYDNEATGPFTVGELLTFTTPAGTAYLAELLDLGDYGEMYIGPMQSGSAPQDNSTIAGATATADVNGAVYDDINVGQLTLNGALIGAAVTSVVVNEAIPADTPATGTIRIKRASGKYTRHPYSDWDSGTKTFTITSHDFSGDNAPDGSQVFISYIDEQVSGADYLDYTAINIGSRSLFVRVRDGGATPIKPFETTATFPGSTTAVRTSDA